MARNHNIKKKKSRKRNLSSKRKKNRVNSSSIKKNTTRKNVKKNTRGAPTKINRNVPASKKIIKRKKIRLKPFIFLIVIILIIVSCIRFCKNSYKLKIELKGKADITLEYGMEYKDDGAIASYDDIDLTDKIEVDTNINLKEIGSYYYQYTVEYKNKTKKVKRNIEIKDTTKPKITLNGSSSVTIYVGSSYKEEGAKAVDNYDGDISKRIVVSGKVNNKKKGVYTITYKVSDKSNNTSSIKRKVTVNEKPKVEDSKNNNQGTVSFDKTSKGYKIINKNGLYYIDGILIVNKTYSVPSTYNPGGLQKVFMTNFNKMKEDAKKEGITLTIVSGFRSYNTQDNLYNKYVNADGREEADRYSARPGHSEHQTGLAADINKIAYDFGDTKEGKWLNDNCYKYGFVIRYTKEGESKTGYMFEPWHIRYLGVNIATKLYNNGNWIALEEYLGITSSYD